jgi:hypothetical protein
VGVYILKRPPVITEVENLLSKGTDQEKFVNSLFFAMRCKAHELKVDPGSIIAIGLNPIDRETEEWLSSEHGDGLIMAILPAKEGHCINPEYVEAIGKIHGFMEQARKCMILRKNKDGAAARDSTAVAPSIFL